jgi:hypothetical protein
MVSQELISEALINQPEVRIAIAAFLLIAFLKRDVAWVAIGAMLGGITRAFARSREKAGIANPGSLNVFPPVDGRDQRSRLQVRCEDGEDDVQ